VLKTVRRRAQLRLIIKYTRDEPCGILSTLIARNIRDGEWKCTLCYSVRCHQDANAFQRLQQRLRQTQIVKRPEILNTGRSRNVGTPTMKVL